MEGCLDNGRGVEAFSSCCFSCCGDGLGGLGFTWCCCDSDGRVGGVCTSEGGVLFNGVPCMFVAVGGV